MTDIEIVSSVKSNLIEDVAKKIGINDIDLYGKYKCKINSFKKQKDGKAVIVSVSAMHFHMEHIP